MISLSTIFWLMVLLFSVVGWLRGWTKEVIVMASMVLSLFAIDQFSFFVINRLVGITDPQVAAQPEQRQFFLLAIIHLTFAFFGYQGPAIVGGRVGERLRIRETLQDKLLGAVIGGFNGYLLVGSLWAFLEYQLNQAGVWNRLNPGVGYPFEASVIVRPDIALEATTLIGRLPIPLLAPYLPILVVVVFLFVIVVMI